MSRSPFLTGLGAWTLDLVRVGPAPHPRWPIATQAALAMALPVGLFTLVGQPLVGLQAAGGAFTALYLASATVRERAKALPLVGLLLLACAAAGTAAAADPTAVLLGLVAVTVVSSALAYAFALGPPGPVFFVLVYGMATTVTAAVDGARRVEPLAFLAAFAVGCLLAYAVAVAPLVVPGVRRRPARALRALVGAGLFALIALVSIPAPLLALVLAALQFLIELVVVRNYALALVFITPLVLLISTAAVPGADPGGLASERVVDTLLGAVLGMLTAFIHPRQDR